MAKDLSRIDKLSGSYEKHGTNLLVMEKNKIHLIWLTTLFNYVYEHVDAVWNFGDFKIES